MELLTFATAGSVDDGKSTLIGRLLHDTKSLSEDQLDAVERTSVRRGQDRVDLALVTDGLRAEREQGITIDVAYRYFATERRAFIVADTPGHVQYTRNMVCGASVADLAVVLVDARHGLTEQSRRHLFLISLLEVPHLVVAVNKMDLVGFSQERFAEIRAELTRFVARLRVPDLTVIPLSALEGDNVVVRSEQMPWYSGPALLQHLEDLHFASDRNLVDVRFPVQYVLRPRSEAHHDYRAYAGAMAGGVLRVGDDVVALPSGVRSTVAAIDGPSGPLEEAYPPMSVAVRLHDDVDVGRGDTLCRPNNAPVARTVLDAMVCAMDVDGLRPGDRLLIKQTTTCVPAVVEELRYRVDVNTLRQCSAERLEFNEIGRVGIRTSRPVVGDAYRRNRTTGSFILIDPTTNRTVAAGIVDDRQEAGGGPR